MATTLSPLPPFPGIRSEGIEFLRGLREHNEREWFKPRKQTYEDELKGPLRCLVADVARRLDRENVPLTGDPSGSTFRIYRDVRFSNNKAPYKTHVSCVFTRSGSKKDDGVLYVHIEPANSYVAVGFYRKKAKFLRPVRQAIVGEPERFFRMQQQLEANGLTLTHGGNPLKGMPNGFHAHRDSDLADVLRWQSYLVRRPVDDAALDDPTFSEFVVAMGRDGLPLLEYVWQAHERE